MTATYEEDAIKAYRAECERLDDEDGWRTGGAPTLD